MDTTACRCAPLAYASPADLALGAERAVEEVCPGRSASTAGPSPEMLGCLTGPAVALEAQWRGHPAKRRQRTRSAAATPMGANAVTADYERNVITEISYKVQLHDNPEVLIQDEPFVPARLLRSSGSLLRRNDYFNLEETGLARTSPISELAMASRMRAASATLTSWRSMASKIGRIAMEVAPRREGAELPAHVVLARAFHRARDARGE